MDCHGMSQPICMNNMYPHCRGANSRRCGSHANAEQYLRRVLYISDRQYSFGGNHNPRRCEGKLKMRDVQHGGGVISNHEKAYSAEPQGLRHPAHVQGAHITLLQEMLNHFITGERCILL